MRFLFVDRILEMSLGQSIRGVKHITRDDTYLSRDQDGRICFASSLIGEALGQLAAWNAMASHDFTLRPVAGVAASARLHRPAYLGETLLLESFIDSLDATAIQYHSVARVGDDIVFSLDGALGPMLPMSTFIDTDTVRRQFDEIYAPGPWPAQQASAVRPEHEILCAPSVNLAPFLYDRILECEPGVRLVAEKCVTRAASYFPDHFPNKPVLPLTILLECNLQLATEFLAKSGEQPHRVHELRRIKISDFISPGDVIRTTLTVKKQTPETLILRVESEVNDKRVSLLEIELVPQAKKNIGFYHDES